MKDIVQSALRRITRDNTLTLAHKIITVAGEKYNSFAISRAGVHLYYHNFATGRYKPHEIAKKIYNGLKEDKYLP